MIQRTNTIKFLRYLGIFCALTMGFFSIVATSEDDVEDALAQEGDATYGPFTVSKTAEAGAAATESECEVGVSINDALDEVDIDIGDIELKKLEVSYRNATWEGTGDFTCWVELTDLGGGGYDLTTDPITFQERGDTWSSPITATSDELSAINYFLDHRDEEFTICAVCSDNAGDITSYSVEIEINFRVEITPDL